MTPYAELQATTNFSFLRGASHPAELVERAAALGLAAIGVVDRNSFAGLVRAHMAAKAAGLKFLPGVRLDLEDAPPVLLYPQTRDAYGRLCRLVSEGQLRAEKGGCLLYAADLQNLANHVALFPANASLDAAFGSAAQTLVDRLKAAGARTHLAVSPRFDGADRARLNRAAALAARLKAPLVATGDVLMHAPERRALADVLACIREKTTLAEAGTLLEANAERHLKSPEEMARLFRGHEDALARTAEIAESCTFSLDELKYEYPDEPVPKGETPAAYLRRITYKGAATRYPDGLPEKVRANIEKELALISELNYEKYFLTVRDIVRFAREEANPPILCQGRGSAANSSVCYCLGVTNVDPAEIDLLFERFLTKERGEPPDIDVDFEHERREEVIQHLYERYGRRRAGLCATLITYRARSAIREVGKVLGLTEDVTAAIAGTVWGSWGGAPEAKRVAEAGVDLRDPRLKLAIALAREIEGFPRHLSQHVGGFILTKRPLDETVPIGNAAMEDRTVVEWDKDDIEALGMLKVDVLGLGMLTCLAKGFDLLRAHKGVDHELHTIPQNDPATYDMLCAADSVGVFQVESRAQMNMLPRLKPRTLYDLVIEVAIVRPGPIQGDMVHPYLRRRDGLEPEEYPAPAPEHGPPDELRAVLQKTKGVPIFQEQAMRIAMVAAKFSNTELNQLRYAMATFRRRGTIEKLQEKMISRMVERGYDRAYAERCFNQIKGFGEYGFPESHAASFAHLVYVSSWMKCWHPDVFACALLNSQPMGFYAPAQIVKDAREHGVTALEADVNYSLWDNVLEPAAVLRDAALRAAPQDEGGAELRPEERVEDARREGRTQAQEQRLLPLRLGFRQIDGFKKEWAESLVAARAARPFESVEDLRRQAALPARAVDLLAAADAFRSLGLDRRRALWEAKAMKAADALPLFAHADAREAGAEPAARLPETPLSEHVVADYQTTRLSLKAHPVSFLRKRMADEGAAPCAGLEYVPDGGRTAVAGVVLIRQKPGSAKGVCFMTLEDETGVANLVLWPDVLERFRREVMTSRLVLARGRVQKQKGEFKDIIHLVVERLEDRTDDLLLLSEERLAADLARADAVKRPLLPTRPAPTAKRPYEEGKAFETVSRADEVRRPVPEPGRAPGAALAVKGRRADLARHPRNVRILPKSRDFH
ncbi:MAG: error-prone DNA polymerase [Pseudomonadota bacterium]